VKNPNREHWNEQQQSLRQALANPEEHPKAIGLFLSQHAMVHSVQTSESGLWSFADEVFAGVGEKAVRCIPAGGEHSLAWIIWHITRIEDVTMNLLVAGSPQILHQDNWLERMKMTVENTGNGMHPKAVADLSEVVDVEALFAYRQAVGTKTRAIVKQLQPRQLKQKVDPIRLQRVKEEGALLEAAGEILDYWSALTIAGLLLMPPTRHNFLHLNEGLRIKQKCR
jgi:hypothetical protein